MKQTVDALIERAKIEAISQTTTLRFGEVVGTNASQIMVMLEDTLVGPLPLMKGVTAETGDQAWMLQQGALLVCIGVSS